MVTGTSTVGVRRPAPGPDHLPAVVGVISIVVDRALQSFAGGAGGAGPPAGPGELGELLAQRPATWSRRIER